ncbi:MAG: hypothetical protein RL748_1213 [Pseudomonadota bacterium]|jgi:hypothetical protein
MSKSFNAMSKKEIKTAAHTFANLNQEKMGSMLSLALNGGEAVSAQSGAPAGAASALNPYPAYLIEQADRLPWNGLTPTLARPHNTCAEAHLWCELTGRGKNPKNYTLVSFNAKGIIAAPCANCAQWVERAFGAVYAETTSYEGHARQKP